MALPSAGNPISFSQLQSEYGGTNPISISEYYRTHPSNVTSIANITYNSSIPRKIDATNPQVSLSNYFGKSKVTYQVRTWSFSSSGTWTVPTNWKQTEWLNVYIVGGGGQGAGWPSGAEGGGGAEVALLTKYNADFTPGQQFTVNIGAGGTGPERVESGANGGNSSFGDSTTLYTYARGGLGGIASGSASYRNNLGRAGTNDATGLRSYYEGGGTSGRFGGGQSTGYGAGGGAAHCSGSGGTSGFIPYMFSYGSTSPSENFTGNVLNTSLGQGGSGCAGGDRRIGNQGTWPGGGGGGADGNATGGNGAGGGVFVTLRYWGT